MTHWAAHYIGRPWGPPGSGLSCWEFVREVCARHYGRVLPELPADALQAREWGRVGVWVLPASISASTPPLDGDLVLLRTFERLHCGVVVQADGQTGLLHANGSALQAGGVVWERLDLAVQGYQRAELWRHHA